MEFFTGDSILPQTGIVTFAHNLTSFPKNSTHISHPPEINPSSNPELPQGNCPGGGSNFSHFSNSDKDIHQNLYGCDLQFLAQLACQDNYVNKFVDHVNGRNDNTSPGLLRKRKYSNSEYWDMASLASFWETELSLSDDDCEVSEASEGDLNPEKSIVKMPKLKKLLQNLISQVMQKQEQMHKQMIDILEKREKERISLEEAWKKQETERAKVDEEERKQETLQSLALISFIEKLSFQDIESLYSSDSSNRGDKGTGAQNHKCLKDGSNNKRWPKTEIQALIIVRVAVEQKFLVKGAKGPGWKEVAAVLSNMGYNRSPEKCREKWENINKYYRRTMEGGRKRQRPLPYFEELDLIYKKGLLSHGNASS